MSNTTLSRWFASLLVLVASVAIVANCKPKAMPPPTQTSTQPSPEPQPTPVADDFCTTGNNSKNQPLICIDDTTLTPLPNPAAVWDVEKKKGTATTPSNRPVRIRWFTKRTADLIVTFKDQTCVEKVTCDKEGECVAKIKKIDWASVMPEAQMKDKHLPCKYELKLGGTTIDPEGDLHVNPCCW